MLKSIWSAVAVVLLVSVGAAAQGPTTATYVSGDEISAITKSAAPHIVDAGGDYIGLGLQFRPKAEKGKAGNPLVHTHVTEVYIITKGSAVLATGGTLTDAKPFPADGKDNGEGIGPGLTGNVANPHDVKTVKAGDIIIIPANVPHWFVEVPEDLVYTVFRIDPTKVIVLK